MRTKLDRRRFLSVAVRWLAVAAIAQSAKAADDPLTVQIHREAVESTSIASAGFHAQLNILEIEFRSGAVYRYLEVPTGVFEGLQKAETKGRYFSQTIRDRYRYVRLPASKP
jgi:hypothetical protein